MTELEHAIKHIKTRADAWAVKEVENALSQEPSRRKGHWIETEYHRWRCSVCREKGMSEWDNIHNVRTNFCPDCGARMESEE